MDLQNRHDQGSTDNDLNQSGIRNQSSPIADIDFLEPIFGADSAFAPSIYIIKLTL